MEEIEALIALCTIPHLGSIKIRLLLQHFGSAVNTLNAEMTDLADLPGFGPKILQSWRDSKHNSHWKREVDLAERLKVKLIPFTHPDYPKRLLDITDFPVLLYVKGELKSEDRHSIAVVGTRQPGVYGAEMAEKFGIDLAALGFTVVSGLARGIDTAAHRGAMKRGRTIAVIGSGLANIYPHENIRLSERLPQQGALISEFPMSTPPDKQNFPQRNRIVSGMTMGTLLIEAPEKSGAMITMDRAWTQKRKLFAIPGRLDNEQFRGNHLLLKRGHAQLVENGQDIAASFGDLFGHYPPPVPRMQALPLLEKEEEELLRILPKEETSFETIAQKANLPIKKLNVLLMSLMLKKAIREYPGKIYKPTR